MAPALSPRARAEAPAVLRVGSGTGALLGIVGYTAGEVRLLVPGGAVVIRAAAALAALLRAPAEASWQSGVEVVVARAGFIGERGGAVRSALLLAALGGARVAEGARLRPARASVGAALRAAGVGRRLVAALGGYVGQLALLVALWATIGARAVAAGDRRGGAWGWIALIALLAAVRLASSYAAGRLAIDAGAVLRDRILHGLLALDTESVREAGIGQLMGRVADVEAVESLALGGGLTAAGGAFELVTGLCVLALGVAPGGQLAFAALWCALGVALAVRVQRRLASWSSERLALTHDLVERMVGQRTLVAQEPPELWHRDEDRALALYAARGRALDRAVAALTVVVPRGFVIGAVAILAPQLAEAALRPGAFAASLGGILFVTSALRKLAQAFPALGAAAIAWRNIGELLAGDAARRCRRSRERRFARNIVANGVGRRGAARADRAERRSRRTSSAGSDAPLAIERRARRTCRSSTSVFATRDARTPCSRIARSRSGVAIACCSRALRAAASRRWRRCSAGCARRPRAACSSTAWSAPRSATSAGGRASAPRRSSTRTTSFRPASSSTCCSAAPGPPAARTSPRPRRSAASSTSGRSSPACPPASSSWSARAAGSSRTASGDDFILRVHFAAARSPHFR